MKKFGTYIQIRKIGVPVVVMLFFLGLAPAASAQVPQVERKAPPMEEVQPQEQMQRAISYEDEIEENEVPEGIRVSMNETYPDYNISEAFRGSDGSYKIRLEKREERIALFYDAEGEFLRLEEDKHEDTINDDWR